MSASHKIKMILYDFETNENHTKFDFKSKSKIIAYDIKS